MKTLLTAILLLTSLAALAAPALPSRGNVQEFDTITQILASSPSQITTTYTAKGLTAVHDGLGGRFYYRAGDTTATNSTDCFAWGTGRLRRFYDALTASRLSVSGGSSNYIDKLTTSGVVIDIRNYGASTTAGADNTSAIQSAINAGIATGAAVMIPAGTWDIATPLVIPAGSKISLMGAGFRDATLRASAAMTNMITIGDLAAQTEFCTFENFGLDGNALAGKGMWGGRVDHTLFNRLRVTGTTTAGLSIGYGWCNKFMFLEVAYNTGDGLVFNTDYDFGGNNQVRVLGGHYFNNTGWGIKTRGGYQWFLDSVLLEFNKAGGIFIGVATAQLEMPGTYFESNAETGHTFTNSSHVVHADIVMNGTTVDANEGYAFPPRDVQLNGCHTQSIYANGAFVYPAAGEDISIRFNNMNLGQTRSLVLASLDRDYFNPIRLDIGYNNAFTNTIDLLDTPANTSIQMSTWRVASANPQNYCTDNSFDWSVYDGTGTVLQNAPVYQGFKTLILQGTDNNSVMGVSLDLTLRTELVGRLCYVGAWCKASNPNTVVAAYETSRGSSSDAFIGTTNWTWIEQQALITLGGGSTVMGFKLQNAAPADYVLIAKPVIAQVGINPETFYPRTEGMFVRDTDGYRNIGTWSDSGTNQALGFTVNGVRQWTIETNGVLTAQGAYGVNTSGYVNGSVLRATDRFVYLIENGSPSETGVYYYTPGLVEKGMVGFPTVSSSMHMRNTLTNGIYLDDWTGVHQDGPLFNAYTVSTNGFYLMSPDATRWHIKVDNTGVLSTVAE